MHIAISKERINCLMIGILLAQCDPAYPTVCKFRTVQMEDSSM